MSNVIRLRPFEPADLDAIERLIAAYRRMHSPNPEVERLIAEWRAMQCDSLSVPARIALDTLEETLLFGFMTPHDSRRPIAPALAPHQEPSTPEQRT